MQRRPTKRYWASYKALYGEQTELITKPKSVIAKPKSVLPTEQQEQFVAVNWLRKRNILFYHVPNGGYRDYREAAKFKRLGVQPGVPDICVPVARKGYHGLYIELKRVKGGALSETQQWWRDQLIAEGYLWYEAKGAADLIEFVENYLR